MPRYYNKTRGPLPLSLPSGTRIAPAKSYVEIDVSDEGCASVVKYVKKGLLVPPKIRPAPAAAPAPAPKKAALKKIKAAPAPAPMPEPEPVKDEPEVPAKLVSSDEVEMPDEDSSKEKAPKSAKKTTKKRTRR